MDAEERRELSAAAAGSVRSRVSVCHFRWEMVGEKEPTVISVDIKETITLWVISQQWVNSEGVGGFLSAACPQKLFS